MKDLGSINESELDGALNALFLETYGRETDEKVALFCLEQNYNVIINPKKEAALLARLGGKQGGGKNISLLILALLLIIVSIIFLFTTQKEDKKIASTTQQTDTSSTPGTEQVQNVSLKKPGQEKKNEELKPSLTISPLYITDDQQKTSVVDSVTSASAFIPEVNKEPVNEKILPYFNEQGLAYFAKVKESVLQKLVRIDDLLYTKTEPGATMYKGSEVLVSPFVMSSFPVTNLQYKTFLADLARQERMEDLKKCLPKEEVWKEYGCNILAENYFENETYNDFPVVNVTQEACMIFCEWLEEETNQELAGSAKTSKFKGPVKRAQVTVRLPYDYEWIYSADAAYTLIPDCKGYNTIYDPGEGLVDKDFFKHTSRVNKRELRKETRMDKLSDVNRFGMTEAEIIAIFKEAINYNDNNKKIVDPSDPASYPNNIEAACLAGHVCELIKNKEGGMTVRGCCWKSKEEYMKMMETYKKNGASPFIGFRVVILNPDRGTNKNPFW